jgi:hypothetical protein
MATKEPHYIHVGTTGVIRLQLVSASYNSGLLSDLGITKGDASGESPEGKILLGTGRLAALQNGCFGVNLVYAATPLRNQTAKVLCSPTKADTVFTDAKSATYRGKNIVDVRVPRRRIFTF